MISLNRGLLWSVHLVFAGSLLSNLLFSSCSQLSTLLCPVGSQTLHPSEQQTECTPKLYTQMWVSIVDAVYLPIIISSS